ncbi:flavoprotein [Actinosynnema sp. NPDC020468]|uniref:flavoprotein n=1 Tax=Actinosynnema sp. NPDC020468 TaxID=3154488 RepID=UPI0033FCD45C
MNTRPRTAYLIATAAPPLLSLHHLVSALHTTGWNVHLITTPTAASWLDSDALPAGTTIRTGTHPPDHRDPLPRADAVLVAPATFNTINKWAHGISDNLALALLNELLGTDVPILVAPCVKQPLRDHPAYHPSTRTLTAAHATLLDPDHITTRLPDGATTFRWDAILNEFAHLTGSA